MPFTLAHPAAALPLARALGPLGVPTALAIGSMTPDAAYFLPVSVDRPLSHSLAGVLWFCLPVGLVAYVAFFTFVAPLACAIAPRGLRARAPRHWVRGRLPARSWLAVTVSVVAGALTHLLWDAFTHREGAALVPLLGTGLVTIEGYHLTVYKLAQHGSTLAGFALLWLWALRWYRACSPGLPCAAPSLPRQLVLALLIVTPPLAAGLLAGWEGLDLTAHGALRQLQTFARPAVMACGTVALPWLLVAGLGWRWAGRAREA